MSDKKDNKKNSELLDSEDYEYEKKIYDEQKKQEMELEAKRAALREERKKREKEAQRERERQLAKERIELMKHKGEAPNKDDKEEESCESEAAEEDDDTQDETETVRKKSIVKKADNFFYHNKWWIGLTVIVLCIGGFILYNELTRKRPDLTVYMIADNDLKQRQQPLEEFFEQYVGDLDGNGYVHVEVQIIPLDRTTNDQTQQDNNSMFLSAIYSTENMLVITDSNTDDYYMEIMDHDLKSRFPDNKYVDENGFSMNMKLIAEKLDFDHMPNDIHISIRQPVATVEDSFETAQKNYDKNYKILEKMINDLTKQAEETNDPGLSTEPTKKDSSSSQAEE